jgi:hypothetical protein
MDVTYRLALLVNERITFVVLDIKTQASRVNVPVSPDKESTEDGLGQEVEHTIEDGLRVGRDDVTSLSETPCDGVEDPQESSERSAKEERTLDVTSVGAGVNAGLPDQLVHNVNKSEAAEGEVSPLVLGLDESTDETGNNHDLVDEDGPQDSGPWHSGGEQKISQEKRSRNEPIDVADVVDGTVSATNNGVAALVLDANGSESEVGTHGEVGNGSDKDNSSGDVVEDAVAARLALTEADEDEAGDGHGRAYGEIEVRAMGGDGDVSGAAVDSVVCCVSCQR